MAFSWYGTIKKIGEFFGLDKKVKNMGIIDDDAYNEASDYIDNHTDKEIDKLIQKTPTGGAVLQTRDDPLGVGEITDWAKGQVEASTGDAANKTNKEIAEQNLNFEREKFDYDKALQQEIFQREDTANQRTVNDMRLAGLNPLNMQGTNGAGNVVATSAPHNDFQMQSTQALQLMDTIFNSALQAKATQSNNSLQSANANLLDAQAENQRIKNRYEESILAASVIGSRYDNQQKYWNNINTKNNYLLNRAFGWTENMPDWMKQSSSRLGFRIFDDMTPLKTIEEDLKDNYRSYSPIDMQNLYFMGNKKVSQQLLSDELLMGSLGIFGNILKLLTK